jgi:hypothetical protein
MRGEAKKVVILGRHQPLHDLVYGLSLMEQGLGELDHLLNSLSG